MAEPEAMETAGAAGRSRADVSGSGKGFAALFVRRPILAIVVNSLIVIAGLAAGLAIEVRELPDIDRPVITVTTTYDGAAPRPRPAAGWRSARSSRGRRRRRR